MKVTQLQWVSQKDFFFREEKLLCLTPESDASLWVQIAHAPRFEASIPPFVNAGTRVTRTGYSHEENMGGNF